MRSVGNARVAGARRASPRLCYAVTGLALALVIPSPTWGDGYAGVSVLGGVASRYSSEAVPNSAFGGTALVSVQFAEGIRGLGELGLGVAYARYQADFAGGADLSLQVPLYRYRVSILPVLLQGALEVARRHSKSPLVPVVFAGAGVAHLGAELRSEYDLSAYPGQNVVTESAGGWVPAALLGLGLRLRLGERISASVRTGYLWAGALSGRRFHALPINGVRGLQSGVIAAGIQVAL